MRLYEQWTATRCETIVEGLFLFSQNDLPTLPNYEDSPATIERSRKPRILVIDDEEVIARSLKDILCRAGFDARFALSGIEGIEIAGQSCPEIVISDVIMPELDGVQTAIRIRRACPGARVILFSGQAATTNILEKARSEGHEFELLPKPIHPARLLAVVGKPV